MLYVKYRSGHYGLTLVDREFDDEEDAESAASSMRAQGYTEVELLVDLRTADETAAAMAFHVPPVAGVREQDGSWTGTAPAAASVA